MSETYDVMDRLRKVKLTHQIEPAARLYVIARTVMNEAKWPTIAWCHDYRDKLVNLLESAWNDGFDDGFASADDWCAENEDAMREHGWVRAEDTVSLPVDMNGNRVHAGDSVIAQNGKSYRVECVALRNNNTWCVVITDGFSDPHVLGIYVDCDTVCVVKGTQ